MVRATRLLILHRCVAVMAVAKHAPAAVLVRATPCWARTARAIPLRGRSRLPMVAMTARAQALVLLCLAIRFRRLGTLRRRTTLLIAHLLVAVATVAVAVTHALLPVRLR